MPNPIRLKDSIIAGLRPMRSAMRPMTRPPNGRVKKPTPNVASEASRLVVGSCEGKKHAPICVAKNA